MDAFRRNMPENTGGTKCKGSVPGCCLEQKNPSWSVNSSAESAHYQWLAVRIPQPLGAITLPLADSWYESGMAEGLFLCLSLVQYACSTYTPYVGWFIGFELLRGLLNLLPGVFTVRTRRSLHSRDNGWLYAGCGGMTVV